MTPSYPFPPVYVEPLDPLFTSDPTTIPPPRDVPRRAALGPLGRRAWTSHRLTSPAPTLHRVPREVAP